MRFLKSQPAGGATLVPPSASTGPLKIWMHHPPHEKRTPTKCTKKLAAVGRSHDDAHPDNSTLHTGAVRPHTGFVGGALLHFAPYGP